MTLIRSHTTDPFDGGEGGSYRTWWVADGPRMVALSVLQLPSFSANPDAALVAMLQPHRLVTVDGTQLRFDAVYTHEPQHGDACKFHANCEACALSDHHGLHSWQRIVAAGWSDDAVYAELERLHGEIFAEMAR